MHTPKIPRRDTVSYYYYTFSMILPVRFVLVLASRHFCCEFYLYQWVVAVRIYSGIWFFPSHSPRVVLSQISWLDDHHARGLGGYRRTF